MIPLMAVAAGAQAATGLISGITGLFQKARANRLERENVRPIYSIPQEIRANQQIAQQQATMGLPGAQYAQGLRNIDRNATSALAASQDRRAGLSSIGAIQQSSNDAGLNLTAMDAQARQSNIRNLIAQNGVMAQYRDKQWGWNDQAKFQENAAAIRQLRGAGNQNFNAGLNGIISAGVTAADGFGDGSSGGGGGGQYGYGYGNPSPMMQRYQSFRTRGFQ